MQSQRVLRSGDRFCSINSDIFDQVMPLSTVEELATYAQSKPIQQALAVDECPPAPTPRGRVRYPVDPDHAFRWIVIIVCGDPEHSKDAVSGRLPLGQLRRFATDVRWRPQLLGSWRAFVSFRSAPLASIFGGGG